MDWRALLSSTDWSMVGALATIGTLLLAVPGFLLALLSIRRQLKKIEKQNEAGVAALEKLTKIRRMSEGDQNALWSRPLEFNGLEYHDWMSRSIPIVLVMNFKGGVGKTTIAGNLAADCVETGERVLAIDLDYQGSLSSLLMGHANIIDKQTFDDTQRLGAELLRGQRDAYWVTTSAKEVSSDLSKLKFIPTASDLADVENRLMMKWMLDEAGGDIRLNLARVLLSEEIQSRYNRIIIDTGPRPTTAFINGLCASTHFIIPTILDTMSTSSVANSLRVIKKLKPIICPHLSFAGIVGSKTYYQEPGRFSEREQEAIAQLRREASAALGHGDHFMDNCNIREQAAIATAAGKKLAYFEDNAAKTMFEALGAEVRQRAPAKTG